MSKAPSLKMKGQIYMACLRSCLSYGCDTWARRPGRHSNMEQAEMRMIGGYEVFPTGKDRPAMNNRCEAIGEH